MYWILAPCVLALVSISPCWGLQFGGSYGDHMVLQRGPERAVLYGYANVLGDTVTVYKNDVKVAVTHAHQNWFKGQPIFWIAKLDPETNPGPYTITASSSDGNVTLHDVLYGDVWVCSGQSNMYFKMGQVNNSAEEIQTALDYPDVRMQEARRLTSGTAIEEANLVQHWTKPVKGMIENFSAVCFLFGRNLQSQLHVPIGLIETSWGGTPVEAWSSPDALAKCPPSPFASQNGSHTPSGLWNAMVEPFLKTTIKGAIWYQGEANSHHADLYSCQFPAMVADWRAKFHNASRGETNAQFPFGFVQLAAYRNLTGVGGFPPTRWAQTGDVGFVPNPRMPNTFMAVALDLPDFTSPYGAIHPRYKQDVAERLTLGARAVAYGEKGVVVFQGPFPTQYHLDQHHRALQITFDNGSAHLIFHNATGFEICCATSATSDCTGTHDWHYRPITDQLQSHVTIDAHCQHGLQLAGVRYLWRASPCVLKKCPLYGATNYLPVPPFVKIGRLTAGTEIIG